MKDLKNLPPSRYIHLQAKPMLDLKSLETSPTARQEAVPGFDQEVARRSSIFFAGAGGLTAEQAPGVVRKGYGSVGITDMDFFEPSNYSRQFCYGDNLYENKGIELAKNLARESVLGTELLGLAMPFQDAAQCLDLSQYQVGVCNVDNNDARREFCVTFHRLGIPAIFCGVSADANNGYVFVQEAKPDSACWGCAFPQKVEDRRRPCPGTPACKDILKVLGGLVLYAIDSLLMPRPRNWNLRLVFLAGYVPDVARTVPKATSCPLCGQNQ